jgi:hypothetical protein
VSTSHNVDASLGQLEAAPTRVAQHSPLVGTSYADVPRWHSACRNDSDPVIAIGARRSQIGIERVGCAQKNCTHYSTVTLFAKLRG